MLKSTRACKLTPISASDAAACSAQAAIDLAKKMQYSAVGDSIVALHRIGNASVIKIVDVK